MEWATAEKGDDKESQSSDDDGIKYNIDIWCRLELWLSMLRHYQIGLPGILTSWPPQ